jgi:uncharacterized membrane protein (UPF0136 family)
MSRKKVTQRILILILSIIGLIICITLLFPQVREMVVCFIEQKMIHRELLFHSAWIESLFSFAMGGICLIFFINYCIQTSSGRKLVYTTKEEMKDCWLTIDFRSFLKPAVWMVIIYSLGVLTIIRANYLYEDDILRTLVGSRGWHNWSRYVPEFLSMFVHANFLLTDISPLPQLLAVLILAVSSVLLVSVLCDKKITVFSLLASIPLGLSPYFLECLSFKFDAPYMALSIFASIFPFLFINRKKAFFFCSVVALLIMYMTYQAASGIYLLIAIVLCFQDWNTQRKTNKEILSVAKMALFAFCLASIIFKFFFMKPPIDDYISNNMYPFNRLFSGIWINMRDYLHYLNSDFGIIWKICIAIVLIFFVFKSIHISSRRKLIPLLVSFLILFLSFVLSYGIYYVLERPLFEPRALFGFGVWLAILCIYIVSNYRKIAIIPAFALSWCFFVFAFSYGNALADQMHYTDFRISILLHDLSTLYPRHNGNDITVQLKNTIDYTPSVKHIAKLDPVIERLIRIQLKELSWKDVYYTDFYNFGPVANKIINNNQYVKYINDFNELDLPVVLDSYYHTIKSDGKHVLVILNH